MNVLEAVVETYVNNDYLTVSSSVEFRKKKVDL